MKTPIVTYTAKVVDVEGHSYRGLGAKMAIYSDNSYQGTISGGCLEAEILEIALKMQEESIDSRLVEFDLASEDAILHFGNRCGGIIKVLIQRCTASLQDLDSNITRKLMQRVPCTLFTFIAPESTLFGKHLLLKNDEILFTELATNYVNLFLSSIKDETLEHPRKIKVHFEHEDTSVLAEPIYPSIRLQIFGCGQDVVPIVSFAKILNWEVEIFGNKPLSKLNTFFPDAKQSFFIQNPQRELANFRTDKFSAVLLMTHHIKRDTEILKAIHTKLPEASYVGILGHKERTKGLLDSLPNHLTQENIHSPMGLNFGAKSPEEIALATIAEIKSIVATT